MKYCEYCDRWWSNSLDTCGVCNEVLQDNEVQEDLSDITYLEVDVGHA